MSEEDVRLEKVKFNEHIGFASHSTDYKGVKSNLIKKYDINAVINALENPVKNYKILQETSLYLSSVSMTYRRLLLNFSSMVNFDFMLKPTLQLASKSNKSNVLKNYYESANVVEKINPKNFKWMSKALWETGELYLYKIEDKNGIVYKRMPEQICRISSVVDNSVCLYSIDMSMLANKDLLATMPIEIQKEYERYVKKTIKPELLVDGKWLEITKNAVAFNIIDPFMIKGYPILSPLFPSLLALEGENRKIVSNAEVDNLKIVHMKYEVDEDGNSIIDPKLIVQFHEALKQGLPSGCAVSTNPLNLLVHNTKNQSQSVNYRKESKDIVYSSVGTSNEIFNGERSSNMAIEVSTKSDEIFALSIASQFENYLNYELKKNKKTSYWLAKLLPITHYNQTEYQRKCETSLSLTQNSNMLRYQASCGYTPLEAMALLQAEKDLGIGELFVPAMNGYNVSSNDNGRPTNESSGSVAEGEGE